MQAIHQLLDKMNDDAAGAGAIILAVGFALWKLYLRVRKDTREDRTGDNVHRGYSSLLDEIQETVRRQGETIDRQGTTILELVVKLDRAEDLRRQVQDENSKLRRRVRHLEEEVRRLGGAVVENGDD